MKSWILPSCAFIAGIALPYLYEWVRSRWNRVERDLSIVQETNVCLDGDEHESQAPLGGNVDRFGGVTVRPESIPNSPEEFEVSLTRSILVWRREQRRVLWLTIPIEKGFCTPIAARLGFKFHHARDQSMLLYRWFEEGSIDNVPYYAHTQVGVGGVVLTEDGKILIITEKYQIKGVSFKYKIPGGLVDPKEDLFEAGAREVFEETGVRAKFVSVLGFRHTHRAPFSTSDLYFILLFRPESLEITPDPNEVSSAEWMPLEEFVAMETFDVQKWVSKLAWKAYEEFRDHRNSSEVIPGIRKGTVLRWDQKSTDVVYSALAVEHHSSLSSS